MTTPKAFLKELTTITNQARQLASTSRPLKDALLKAANRGESSLEVSNHELCALITDQFLDLYTGFYYDRKGDGTVLLEWSKNTDKRDCEFVQQLCNITKAVRERDLTVTDIKEACLKQARQGHNFLDIAVTNDTHRRNIRFAASIIDTAITENTHGKDTITLHW